MKLWVYHCQLLKDLSTTDLSRDLLYTVWAVSAWRPCHHRQDIKKDEKNVNTSTSVIWTGVYPHMPIAITEQVVASLSHVVRSCPASSNQIKSNGLLGIAALMLDYNIE